MMFTPTITRDDDGKCTLHWRGPDATMVAREVLQQYVDEHNELIDRRVQVARLAAEVERLQERLS